MPKFQGSYPPDKYDPAYFRRLLEELKQAINVPDVNMLPLNPLFDSINLKRGDENGVGTVTFNVSDKTLDVKLSPTVTANMPTEQLMPRVVNKSGADIPNGSAVYISGAQGQRPTIELADASSYATSSKTMGFTTEYIANNAEGFVTRAGYVRDIDTSAIAVGTCVYLDTTAGGFTATKPDESAGENPIIVGMVVESHSTHGIICVKITPDKSWFGDLDNGNYSYFEADGTLVCKGDATTWDDLNGSVLELKVQGTGLSINVSENSLDFTTSANLSDYAFGNFQASHKMLTDSDVYPHIHWVQKENNTPNFLIQYRVQVNGSATVSSWTNLKCNTDAFTYVSGNLNQISYSDPISVNGLSSIIELRILRDNSNASGVFTGSDPYTQTANIKFVDMHYPSDTLGSRQQYTK